MKKFSWRLLTNIIFFGVILFYLAPLAIQGLPEWWSSKKLKLGLDLRGGMQILLDVDTSQLSQKEIKDAVDSNIEVIRNRIDQYGVAEPVIQKVNETRILIQLPGVKDLEGARKLVKQTAMLEFKLVAEQADTKRIMEAVDSYVKNNIQYFPELAKLSKSTEKKPAKKDSLKTKADSTATTDGDKLFSSLVLPSEGDWTVQWDNVDLIEKLLADTTFTRGIPTGYQIAIGKEDKEDAKAERAIYVLNSNVEMTGSYLSKSKVEYGSPNSSDPNIANKPYISITMTREGARKFEAVTANNINKRLAIVLDGVVYSAPVIKDRIAQGQAQITGRFNAKEVSDLNIVLNTGNLKAKTTEQSINYVGSTLGSDSIHSGLIAGLVGLLAVTLFMLFYYKLSGFIADIALIFNIGFIIAMLTAFGAALTLPGIAGIILTIGMAVDANVLIFERIREELDNGKTPRTAVDAGWNRAVITIWDSNLTTLIAAAVLYNFGSGPIRGFAVTLTIGIIGSMYCAIVLVRSIFDNMVLTGVKKSLSI